jgi:hypothetical protein
MKRNSPLYLFSLLTIFSLVFSLSVSSATPIVVSGGPYNDYESWIARLNDNRLMVVFTRNPDWSSGDLYVTFSDDSGMTWDSVTPIIVDTGDQSTLSFAQLPGDTIRLWYASNESGTYHIYSSHSIDGINWVKEGVTDLGWLPSTMYYDPTVILEPDSSLTMSYVVSGMGGYIAHCPYGGQWDTLKTLVGQSGFRPRVMKHDNGTYLFAYHRKSGPGQYDYDVFVRTSTDRISWSDSIRLTNNLNSHDPFPNQAPDGAYLVYYAKYQAPAYNLHRRRSYDAVNWEGEEQITSDPTNNTQPHFFSEGSEIYLVWAHCVSYPYDHDVYFERFPYVGIKEKEISTIPTPISLSTHPNPFTSEVRIRISGVGKQRSENRGQNSLQIYDISGREVRKLSIHNSTFPTVVMWDGKDENGIPVPSGMYYIILTSKNEKFIEKITLFK